MSLTRLERERINDSRMKIEAVAESLTEIDPTKVPEYQAIQECLGSAHKNLGAALRPSSGS